LSARPRPPAFAVLLTACAFLLLYVPLAAMVFYSFLDPLGQTWGLKWYAKALGNRQILDALWLSIEVGTTATVVTTVLGTAAALALSRGGFIGRKTFDAIAHVPLITPDIVIGLSLLVWFVMLGITLGTFSIILAHVTFSLSYVILSVRTRLEGFDRTLEEAARDLGADAWRTFRYVTFPLIWPGILSGALLAFTLSFDDFLVAFFTAGPGSDTLPLKIYGMIKYGATPEINALSTLLLGVTLVMVLAFFRPFRPAGGRPLTADAR
jgi:ABC-type spermidine/putrescine transport system permease subunit II